MTESTDIPQPEENTEATDATAAVEAETAAPTPAEPVADATPAEAEPVAEDKPATDAKPVAEESTEAAAESDDAKTDEAPVVEEVPAPVTIKSFAADARYIATGKRKTAVARVILKPGTGVFVINGRTMDDYFPREISRVQINSALECVGHTGKFDVQARMHGGGVSAQAGALRHGIAKALLEADPALRGTLKSQGFLTRDSRVKERKKAGLKKARKRPQFSKR